MAPEIRILVTRAGAEGRRLAERLRRERLTAIHYAPVRLASMPDMAATRVRLLDCLPVDVLVAPSAEALRQLARMLDPAQFESAVTIVPGPGTARAGRELGFRHIRHPEHRGDSEHILDLPALHNVAGASVLIAAAAGGRRLIETTLRERGAIVRRLEVYRRLPERPGSEVIDAIRLGSPLITLLASGGALNGLRQQLPEDCWQVLAAQAVVVPSPRVADLARELGCTRVTLAAGADDGAMLQALERLCPSPPVIS